MTLKHTVPKAHDDENLGEATCEPWPMPYADIRLQVVENNLRIYGYPKQLPYATLESNSDFAGPPFLSLRGGIPAYVQYIMGENWRDSLVTADNHGGMVILRPTLADSTHDISIEESVDEEHHCLRKRRCSALVMSSLPEIVMKETPFYTDPPLPSERQVFGWPDEGGVWIFRSPTPSGKLTQ